jgi:hypothetical protein
VNNGQRGLEKGWEADPKKEEKEEEFQPELMIGRISPTHVATSYCKQSLRLA